MMNSRNSSTLPILLTLLIHRKEMFNAQVLGGDIQRRADGCDSGEDPELLTPKIQCQRNRRVVQVFHHMAFPVLRNAGYGQSLLQQPVGLIPEGAGTMLMVDAL